MIELMEIWYPPSDSASCRLFSIWVKEADCFDRYYQWQQLYAQMMGWA